MHRRYFVGLSAAALGAIICRPLLHAQAKRAAVVIGIDKAGDLTRLQGAASGAIDVGMWLEREGFAVTRFVDVDGPVRVNDIYQAVADLVSGGTITQLVVYFAGHGFISNYSEFWMLSNAPA